MFPSDAPRYCHYAYIIARMFDGIQPQLPLCLMLHLFLLYIFGRFSISQVTRDVEKGRKPEHAGKSSNSSSDEDDGGFLFDKQTRKDFVAKVYAILTLQLAITFVIIFSLCYSEVVREFITDYFWIIFIFMVVEIVLYCVIVCSQTVRRMYPLNFILLTIHTLFLSLLAAWVSARYEIIVIWLAFLSTAIITLLVTVFAKFSPWDVTGCGMFICIGFLAVGLFSIIAFIVNIFMQAPLLFLIISGILVVLLCFYLMFITQMILGGRKGEFEPDEVVLAVIILYTTIIEIFMQLLHLIGACMGQE